MFSTDMQECVISMFVARRAHCAIGQAHALEQASLSFLPQHAWMKEAVQREHKARGRRGCPAGAPNALASAVSADRKHHCGLSAGLHDLDVTYSLSQHHDE